jgi:FAD synthetase
MKKVMVGGVFNILHPGHRFFLKKAKSLGDFLIVIIASDKTVLRNKKPLIFSAEKRKQTIESLKFVDSVRIGYEINNKSGYLKTIKLYKPDIIALGYDQKIDEKDLKEMIKNAGLKCDIVRIHDKLKNYSTSKILEK